MIPFPTLTIIPCICFGITLATSTITSNAQGWRSSEVKLTHEISKEAVNYKDLNGMASDIGIDFPVLLEQALKGNEKQKRSSVFLLLWMAENAPLDGAGAEGYTNTLIRVAKLIGDDFINEAAKLLNKPSKTAVRDAFLFEYGGDDNPQKTAPLIIKEFPRLWVTLSKSQQANKAQ